VRFENTRFALRDIFGGPILAQTPELGHLLAEVAPEQYREQILESAPTMTVLEGIQTGFKSLADSLDLTVGQVQEILNYATGLTIFTAQAAGAQKARLPRRESASTKQRSEQS
jgi:predicted ATP-dependent serine protease